MTSKTESFNNQKVFEKGSFSKNNLFQKFVLHIELIAALLSGAIILITWSLTSVLPHSLWIILHIVAFLIGGYAQAKEGIISTIEEKTLNVELLMIIAAIGAAAIGFWSEGAILIFIFALAGALETYTLDKSNKEISSLMDLQPEEARILTNETEKLVPVSELQVGDIIFVKASERIPADGMIIKGSSSIDESPITGESIPVSKDVHTEVFAGTVALNGSLTVEITKPANETVFQKIIEMIQSATAEKTPVQLFIEKFEGTYVNIVLATVIVMMFLPYLLFDWTLTESIYRAMILLVVASPCALVASIMPATLSAISNSAKQGVLFKGGVHMENLSQMNVIAFDKTGTLTNGTPVVTDVFTHPEFDKDIILRVVGAIESESTHPLARAITNFGLTELNTDDLNITVNDMTTISGKGVRGTVDGEIWDVGKAEFVGEENAFLFHNGIAKKLASEGKTIVFAKHNNDIVALFALQDTIRKEAKTTIKALKQKGIYTIMLTGDNELTAKTVADELGLDHYIAECLPNEKVDHVRTLMKERGKVAMIGDGINDAPALALSDLGIAMGEGTDVALETADAVLMKSDLSRITESIDLSTKMNRVIKQNIGFSLAVITILIISNFFQVIDLPLGVIGHEGSTILVILNGLRLLK